MAGQGVTFNLRVVSGQDAPSNYTKFFLEQKRAELRVFIDRQRAEVVAAREGIEELRAIIAEFEAMPNQEWVYKSSATINDLLQGELGRAARMNDVIEFAVNVVEQLNLNVEFLGGDGQA